MTKDSKIQILFGSSGLYCRAGRVHVWDAACPITGFILDRSGSILRDRPLLQIGRDAGRCRGVTQASWSGYQDRDRGSKARHRSLGEKSLICLPAVVCMPRESRDLGGFQLRMSVYVWL